MLTRSSSGGRRAAARRRWRGCSRGHRRRVRGRSPRCSPASRTSARRSRRPQARCAMHRQRTVLFVDEIHRFNKAQQDALLPHVERGTVTLYRRDHRESLLRGHRAAALPLRASSCSRPLARRRFAAAPATRALADRERGLGERVELDPRARDFLDRAGAHGRRAPRARHARGRRGACAARAARRRSTSSAAEEALQQKTLLYDKAGEEHYNVISAFIKSLRGSDPDAAVYWLMRMLEAGEDPLFIAAPHGDLRRRRHRQRRPARAAAWRWTRCGRSIWWGCRRACCRWRRRRPFCAALPEGEHRAHHLCGGAQGGAEQGALPVPLICATRRRR